MVLLVVGWNDDAAGLDALQARDAHWRARKLEQLFAAPARLQQLWYAQPVPKVSTSLEDIRHLHGEIQKQGARLAIVIFRHMPVSADLAGSGAYGTALSRTLTEGLQNTPIPLLDLGKALLENHSEQELLVYKGVDHHPNEIAHGIAAREIWQFLQREDLLGSR